VNTHHPQQVQQTPQTRQRPSRSIRQRHLAETLAHPARTRILRFLCEHRYATTKQLARLAADDYTSPRSALRQTSRHLTALSEAGMVTHLERRVGGWQGGSTQSIWALTTTGHHTLTRTRASRQRPHLVSTTFLDHLLAISEVRVTVEETTRSLPGAQCAVQTEPLCWRTHLGPHGQQVTLRPDLALTVTTPEFEDRYFLEVDRATENPARVITTCQRYQHYRHTGMEQSHGGVFPAVIWIVPTHTRARQLTTAIQADPRIDRPLFTVTTLSDLPDLIRNGPP